MSRKSCWSSTLISALSITLTSTDIHQPTGPGIPWTSSQLTSSSLMGHPTLAPSPPSPPRLHPRRARRYGTSIHGRLPISAGVSPCFPCMGTVQGHRASAPACQGNRFLNATACAATRILHDSHVPVVAPKCMQSAASDKRSRSKRGGMKSRAVWRLSAAMIGLGSL